jgi:hypothetical protein
MQRLGWFVMNQGITNAKTGWFYKSLGIGKTLYQIGTVFNSMAYTQINTLVYPYTPTCTTLVDTIVNHNYYFSLKWLYVIFALKIQIENSLKYSDVFT